MTISRIIPLALLLLAFSQAAHGQGGGPSRLSPPPSDRKKDLSTAAEKLRQARENGQLERAKQAAQGAAQKLPSNVTETAKDALQSPETREKLKDAAKSAAETLMPEAQKFLKKDSSTGATDATSSGAKETSPASPGAPAASLGPQPLPLQPLADAPPNTKKTTVTIDADEAAFDSKSAVIIYSGHVRARHPQFYIECEELEVHMAKEDPKAPKKPAPPKDPILAKQSAKRTDSGIEMAIARGPMVVIEKLAENGDTQIGKCKKAVYRSSTGQIVMSDFPQVQRGTMLHIADQPDTEMIFDPNGKLHTNGRNHTVILQAGEESGGSATRGGSLSLPVGNGNPNAQ